MDVNAIMEPIVSLFAVGALISVVIGFVRGMIVGAVEGGDRDIPDD